MLLFWRVQWHVRDACLSHPTSPHPTSPHLTPPHPIPPHATPSRPTPHHPVPSRPTGQPQHWPHVGTFEPAFKSLVEPTSPKASPMEFSPPGTNGTLRVSGSVGAVEAPNLRRRGAEQGYGEPPDGGTLPPIGATAGGASPVASDSSAAGGGSGRRSSGRSGTRRPA